MKRSLASTTATTAITAITALGLLCASAAAAGPAAAPRWKVHDMSRPRPPVVTPPAQRLPAPAPPDAVVLFDGTQLSEFSADQGGPAKWAVRDGVMTVVPGAGGVATKRAFGDAQVHLEWASPTPATGKSQGRGNSGIHLMGRYEIQILDSYGNDTYADGQAAAVYGQYPPLVNASRPAGEWQSFDIFFRRPRFDGKGKLLKPARVTVVHNGVLVQDNVELLGPTMWLHHLPYQAHADRLPFTLQEHGNPVRFRNIWVRELPETPEPSSGNTAPAPAAKLGAEALARYAGTYTAAMRTGNQTVTIRRKGEKLYFGLPFREQSLEMAPRSEREFVLRTTDARVLFDLDASGRPTALTFSVGGDTAFTATREP